MRRPIPSFYWALLLMFLLLAVGEYVALTWMAPHYVVRLVERAANGSLMVDDAHLTFPLTTTLSGLHLVSSTPQSTLSIQRVVMRPQWLFLPTRTLWVRTVRIEQPLLHLTRTKNGTMLWPSLPVPEVTGVTSSDAAPPAHIKPSSVGLWRLQIQSLQVEDGVIEFIDESPTVPFHGVLHHVSLVVGPVALPLGDTQMSFAFRGEFIGHGGIAAPLYCSGWWNVAARDVQASCQLEPLGLAALEPYYQTAGRVQVRVYESTVRSTSQWIAKANQLDGRIQFELGNLTEGDLSVRGMTVVDVKRLTSGEPPRLSAELKISGPLDTPSVWRSEFIPGDARVQQLLKPLLDRGVEMIKIPLWGRKMGVSITPATEAAITSVEEASKKVQEDLAILATPIPAVPPGTLPAAAAPSPLESPASVPAASEQAEGTSPASPPATSPTVPTPQTAIGSPQLSPTVAQETMTSPVPPASQAPTNTTPASETSPNLH